MYQSNVSTYVLLRLSVLMAAVLAAGSAHGVGNTCPGEGNCCQANGTPGCEDVECCEQVCDIEPSCCEANWDNACVNIAIKECESCALQTGACCLYSGECLTTAVSECAAQNAEFQGYGSSCDDTDCPTVCPSDGDCCEASFSNVGCNDAECCETLCSLDPFCCEVAWDAVCASGAAHACEQCFTCGSAESGDCCQANDTTHCNDSDCCETVCGADPFCCDTDWDQRCADAANDACDICAADCPEDLTGDGSVGGADLGTLLSAWGPCDDPDDCPEDLTGSGTVGGADLGTLLSAWGPCP